MRSLSSRHPARAMVLSPCLQFPPGRLRCFEMQPSSLPPGPCASAGPSSHPAQLEGVTLAPSSFPPLTFLVSVGDTAILGATPRSFLRPWLLVLAADQLRFHSLASLKCIPSSFLFPDCHHVSPTFIATVISEMVSRLVSQNPLVRELSLSRANLTMSCPCLSPSVIAAAVSRELPVTQVSCSPLPRPLPGRCHLTSVCPVFPAALTRTFPARHPLSLYASAGCHLSSKPALLASFPGLGWATLPSPALQCHRRNPSSHFQRRFFFFFFKLVH